MKCHEIAHYLNSYSLMDEDDEMRIEIEAHLLDCEYCRCKLGIDDTSLPFSQIELEHHFEQPNDISVAQVRKTVMDRIYAEELWYMPVATKSYKLSPVFRRNISIIIACCLAMLSVAMFIFVFDNRNESKQTVSAPSSGIVDIATATNDAMVTTAIYKGQFPLANLSEPFVMQVVPTFPQYYVALSLLGIMMTIFVIKWFSRSKA